MAGLLLIRGARQLLTLRGPRGPRRGAALEDLGLIRDGAVLIRDGVIEEIGPSRRVETLALARKAAAVDATGRVVMPGFVDSHTHLVHGGASLDEYEARIRGIPAPPPTEAQPAATQKIHALSGRALALRMGLLARLLLRHGTTTVEAKTGYGLDPGGELKVLRVLHALDGHPLDVRATCLSPLGPTRQNSPSWAAAELLEEIRGRGLARFVDVYCDRPGFSLEQTRRFLLLARSLGYQLKIHADQFCRTGVVALAVELECLSADHLEHAGEDDVAALARSQTIATLLPGSAFFLGFDRYAPARALIDAGAAVALATNFNPGTAPSCNMQMVLSLACSRMRMSPAEAINAATINGAYALGCADSVGSLEGGKQADLLVMNVSDYREIPYRFGINHVHAVVKRGTVVYRQA